MGEREKAFVRAIRMTRSKTGTAYICLSVPFGKTA